MRNKASYLFVRNEFGYGCSRKVSFSKDFFIWILTQKVDFPSTFSCSDYRLTIYWLRWCTGIWPILNFKWQRKNQYKREFNMHGKPFVPSASLILAKAQESRAKRLKTGNILVQSSRGALSSPRNSGWQDGKLNCRPRLPYKCRKFGPCLYYLTHLHLFPVEMVPNGPDVSNSMCLDCYVLPGYWFCQSWGRTSSCSLMPCGLWRSLQFVQLNNKLC